MCGIALALFQESLPLDSASLVWERLTASARRRGPDAQDHLTLDCTPATNSEGPSCTLKAFGATLWMRGELTKQPLRSAGSFSKSGGAPDDFLLFNGEIFGGMDVPAGMNDGHVLLEKLKACSGAAADILRVLACVQGPFALIYFRNNKLFYARDRLGRRSLMHHAPTNDESYFFLSSVWPESIAGQAGNKAVEVEPATLHIVDLNVWLAPVQKELIWEPFSSAETPATHPSHPELLDRLQGTLTEATRKRVLDLRAHAPKDCISIEKSQARVAILFSGGLDCATLALLTSLVLPSSEPIDLLNVAFENPRMTANNKSASTEDIYEVPDRQTARATYAELCRLQPARRWNFVLINVAQEESLRSQDHVLDLMAPQNTEMDLSLGIALNKAARGHGVLAYTSVPYASQARILLSGLGADELFGGYSRHRRAFGYAKDKGEEAQWKALADEMEMDLQRIGTRNLGRDDRCTAVHGKEMRYPFLDEDVITFLASLPVHTKCDPRQPEGEGDKRLLRQLAARLGLDAPSKFKKRALQFGSRSAKRANGLVSGTDIVPRLNMLCMD